MRAKVVIIVAVLSVLIIGTLFAFHHRAERSTSGSNPTPSEAVDSPRTQPVAEPVTSPKPTPPPETQTVNSSEDVHKNYVEQRSAQLMDLAMTDDHASLDSITAELTNRDPEIRKAALEATIQFGSRDAIPKLADAASQTDDPNEKAALNDAIEFLKLPSLTEITSHAQPAAGQSVAKSTHKGALGKRVLAVPSSSQ